MIWDVAIIETRNGGDLTLNGNDLGVVNSIENALYLSWFGGNVGASTKTPRVAGEQDFSYWGNFFIQNPDAQFNSLTERTLNNTPLTSAGRIVIENAMKKDLSALAKNNSITVSVSIVSTDRINVALKVVLPQGGEKVKTFEITRNPNTGDFDFNDFDFNDFF